MNRRTLPIWDAPMLARPRIAPLAILVSVVALTSLDPANVAPAGGVSGAVLSAFNFAVSTGVPTVAAWENFNGVDGTNLNGTSTDGGAKAWAVNPAPRMGPVRSH